MELDVKPLLDTDALKNFWCGIEDMDRFIHERLFHSVKYNFCKLFAVVTKNNEIVAMFALSFDSLKLDSLTWVIQYHLTFLHFCLHRCFR